MTLFPLFINLENKQGCPYVIRRTKEVMMEEVCFLKRLAFVILHGIDRYVAREVTEDLGPPGLSPRGIYLLWQKLIWQKYSAFALGKSKWGEDDTLFHQEVENYVMKNIFWLIIWFSVRSLYIQRPLWFGYGKKISILTHLAIISNDYLLASVKTRI